MLTPHDVEGATKTSSWYCSLPMLSFPHLCCHSNLSRFQVPQQIAEQLLEQTLEGDSNAQGNKGFLLVLVKYMLQTIPSYYSCPNNRWASVQLSKPQSPSFHVINPVSLYPQALWAWLLWSSGTLAELLQHQRLLRKLTKIVLTLAPIPFPISHRWPPRLVSSVPSSDP